MRSLSTSSSSSCLVMLRPLSSFLDVGQRINRDSLVEQKRRESASRVIREAAEVDRSLARLQVQLGSFYKDYWAADLSIDELRNAQRRLKTELLNDYLVFSDRGFAWLGDAVMDLRLAEPLRQEQELELETLVSAYRDCLIQATNELDGLWGPFTDLTAKPRSSSIPIAARVDNLNKLSTTGHWGEGITAEDMTALRWVRPRIVVEVSFVETPAQLSDRSLKSEAVQPSTRAVAIRGTGAVSEPAKVTSACLPSLCFVDV